MYICYSIAVQAAEKTNGDFVRDCVRAFISGAHINDDDVMNRQHNTTKTDGDRGRVGPGFLCVFHFLS